MQLGPTIESIGPWCTCEVMTESGAEETVHSMVGEGNDATTGLWGLIQSGAER